jgi:ABC-2 type transport system permease protein
MNAKLIFKMELYKFINDRKYLIIAGVLALLNMLFTIETITSLNSYSGATEFFSGTMVIIYFLSIIFLFIYPFHSLSQDYKNNVMALMMASGVNRAKLYFSKVCATALCSLGLLLVVVFVPFFLISLRFGELGGIIDVILSIFSPYANLGLNQFLWLVKMLLSYVLMIVTINAAVTFTKGSVIAILLYLGLWIVQLTFISAFNPITLYSFNIVSYILYGMFLELFLILLYGYLSIRQMQVQNL